MTTWEFKINGVIVEEPIGWDSVEITAQRDPVYHGLENIISDGMKFWGTGADMITEEYEANGIEGELTFLIRYSCDGGATYTTLFNGILNCFYYAVQNSEVTIKMEPSGFHRTVKNRLDVPINLNSNLSIDHLPMSTINPFDLRLHSKAIIQKASLTQNATLLTVSDSHFFPPSHPTPITIYLPLEITLAELQDTHEFTNFFHFDEDAAAGSPYFTLVNKSGVVTVDYKFKFTFHESIADARSYGIQINLSYGATGVENITTLEGTYFFSQSGGSTSQAFNVSGRTDIPLEKGQFIYARISVSNYTTTNAVPQLASFSIVSDPGNYIKLTQNSIENPSTAKAFLIHEAFAKLTESITGVQDSFRSDFFGRILSEPHQYVANGCGGWTAITNGLNIRKLLDKNLALFPIITTFNDLYSSCDAIWNLGMKIETDGAGKEYIRVEPKEYFYNASAILNTFQVSDLSKYPAQDLIYNTYKTGYEKWNLNVTGSNGIDEYNSTRDYRIPGKKANKDLKMLSKYIASGYVIEETRRVQYLVKPTNDFETDNEMFFVCTNRETVESDLYTTPPVSTSYEAGTVSERDENFTGIDKVLSSPTVYNIRISPVRMAMNWYKYTSASIFKNPTAPISFVAGTGNYQELDIMEGDCVVVDDVSQNQNLLASDLSGINGRPIFLPEYLQFTYPLSYDKYLQILSNSEKAIQVSCGSVVQYTGFLKSVKYGPTSNGGIASFTLLRGECTLGDFNDDFNDDFNIGNC